MKKILTTAAIISLIAVPSVAFASQGADNTQSATTTNVKQEDRQTTQQREDHQANQPAETNDELAGTSNSPEASAPAASTSTVAVMAAGDDDSMEPAEANSDDTNQAVNADHFGSGHHNDNSGNSNRGRSED